MKATTEVRTPAQKRGEAAAREELARLRKALAISAHVQTNLTTAGELKELDADTRRAALLGLTDEGWQELARQAGVYWKKAPSATTRAMVCDILDGVYERRDAQQAKVDALFADGSDVNFRGCS